jgi:hypothetical protein
MIGDTQLEQRIRERAHQIWEEDGRPEGCDHEHWARAEREIAGQDSPPLQPEPIGDVQYAQDRLRDQGEGQATGEEHAR